MPVFTIPIHEFNPHHEPAGTPIGGRFAKKPGGGASTAPTAVDGKAEYQRLKGQWARINNDLLGYIDRPDAPEAIRLMSELKALVKQMYRLNVDPGGHEGVGLPGGPRDVVIVGAGPGGLAAAVMAGTDGLDTLFIDGQPEVGGQAKHSSRIENYPGFPAGTSGLDLAGRLREQAERVGAEGLLGTRVTGISYDPETGLKTLTLDNGQTVASRAVILAGGVAFRRLTFPGSDSNDIVYADSLQLMRQGAGKTVIVLGGSNGAAQAALGAARTAASVTVVSRSPITKGMSDYQVQALRNHPKIRVIEGDEISALTSGTATLKSGTRLPAGVVGVYIGGGADTKWLPSDIRVKDGKVTVDGSLETSMPGVFAVGDLRQGSIGRIGTAVGDGQIAVRSAWDYFERLKQEPRQRTLGL